jgi:mannose-6-phosphate isomerase-like protein (cupin superfamily)
MLSQDSNHNPHAMHINFIGNNNLLVVKHDESSVIVPKQTIRFINQLPISSERPGTNAISGQVAPAYTAKEVTLKAGECSAVYMDYHQRKYWIVLSGLACVTLGQNSSMLSEQQSLMIPVMTENRIENIGNCDLVFIEFRARGCLSGNEVIGFSDELTATGIVV